LRNGKFKKQGGNAITKKKGETAVDEEAEQICGRKSRNKEEIS